MSKHRVDPLLWFAGFFFGVPIVSCLLYVLFLFFSVVLFGRSDECPQNLCP